LKNKDKGNNNVEEVVQNNSLDCATNEEEQWEINNKILQESYEEEDGNINEIDSNNPVNFTNPLE
jgi:hypothetical protein